MFKTILYGKNIILGVCGGIAAYKSVDLLRRLVNLGANVKVVMTKSATKFITPMTFEVLSSNHVYCDFFDEDYSNGVHHVKLAEAADAVILAPVTANTMAKMVAGIADNILTTIMLTITCPVMICPSMNSSMYEHPLTKKNLKKLLQCGYFVLSANKGQLACGSSGVGRLPEPSEIIDRLISYLTPNNMMSKRILITAGPTYEMIDPVRFIGNLSSGKMGFAIARAAENRGACVTLISGPVSIETPFNIKLIKIKSADDMAKEVLKRLKSNDIIIKVAAVSDYKPQKFNDKKIKKKESDISLNLKKNEDILQCVGKRKKKEQVVVGFAAETCDIYQNAKEKLKSKKADMIVANLVGLKNSGFSSDTNQVSIFLPGKNNVKVENLDLMTKDALADLILDRVIDIMIAKKIYKYPKHIE